MSAGLDASTVTPGSTLPDVSRATPAIPLACCADAAGAKARLNARAPAIRNPGFVHFIESLLDRDRSRRVAATRQGAAERSGNLRVIDDVAGRGGDPTDVLIGPADTNVAWQ